MHITSSILLQKKELIQAHTKTRYVLAFLNVFIFFTFHFQQRNFHFQTKHYTFKRVLWKVCLKAKIMEQSSCFHKSCIMQVHIFLNICFFKHFFQQKRLKKTVQMTCTVPSFNTPQQLINANRWIWCSLTYCVNTYYVVSLLMGRYSGCNNNSKSS